MVAKTVPTSKDIEAGESLAHARDKDKEEKPPSEPASSFREFFQFLTGFEQFLVALSFVGAASGGVAQPGMLIAFSSLFNQLGASGSDGIKIPMGQMLEMLYIMICLGASSMIGTWVSIWGIDTVTARQLLRYKSAYLKAVLRQDVGWYDTSHPEELATRFAEAMVKVQKGFKSLPMIFMGLGYGIGAMVIAFLPQYGHPAVAGVTIATVPLLACAGMAMMYFVENGSKLVSNAYANAGGTATECLFSMRTITSLGIERQYEKRYASSLHGVRKVSVIATMMLMMFAGLALASYLLMTVVAVLFGAFQLASEVEKSQFPLVVPDSVGDYHYCGDGKTGAYAGNGSTPCAAPFIMSCALANYVSLDGASLLAFGFQSKASFDAYVTDASRVPGPYLSDNGSYYNCAWGGVNIIIAIFAVMMMGEGFGMAGEPFGKLQVARQAAAKVFQIINRIPTIDSFSEEGEKLARVNGEVELKGVKFAYPSAPEHFVCNGYSLHIQAGTTVALCGPSGSGKSTIIQLIERFYDPLEGVVCLDGVDIRKLNVRWLRSQLGLVSQEPVLFQGTVAENIAYGKLSGGAAQEEIEEAAGMANAHEFIKADLNEGYSTQVGQGGSKLSGGQKQRIAIARAIIKKPSILLLDEATSALDNRSEKIVQAALDEIMTKQRRTTIVIAHRLSTIRHADHIAVLREGAVIEQGTYDSLMVIPDGLFRSLAEKQEALLAQDKERMTAMSPSAEPGPPQTSAAAVPAAWAEPGAPETSAAAVPAAPGGGGAEGGEAGKAKAEKTPVLRVVRMQGDQWASLLLMCVFSAGAVGLSTYAFYEMTVVLDIVLATDPSNMREDAVAISIRLGIYAITIVASFTLSGFFNGLAGSSLTAKLRSRGIAAFMRQEIGFFDLEENSATELTAFLAEKVDKVKIITTEALDVVAQLLGGVTAFLAVVAIYSDWRLLLAWMGMIVLMCAVMPMQKAFLLGADGTETQGKGGEDKSKIAVAQASANNIVGEAVTSIRTVASFNLEHRFYDGYTSRSADVSKFQKQDACVGGFGMGFTNLLMFASMGGVFFYSVWLANSGAVTFTKAMAPLMSVMGVMVPMLKASALEGLPQASAAAVRLFKVFDRVPLVDNLDESGKTLPRVDGLIELKDVRFAYPSAPEHLVCNGYSLVVPAGKTVALCGPSGSGKSTIIQLIERFYDPLEGAVCLDGVDIRTLNVRWLRSQLGLVSQEPVLFQGTVAENIAYGKPAAAGEATAAEIEEAAGMANAHAFITENLAEGYRTNVGLRGGKLSGGQKQRVAIARALIRKPAVLLLDEATSALDNESERIVQAALDDIMTRQKRTTIVIAHRLSTIRSADLIVVVNGGRIVEQGTHEELLAGAATDGIYANLVMSS